MFGWGGASELTVMVIQTPLPRRDPHIWRDSAKGVIQGACRFDVYLWLLFYGLLITSKNLCLGPIPSHVVSCGSERETGQVEQLFRRQTSSSFFTKSLRMGHSDIDKGNRNPDDMLKLSGMRSRSR